MESPNVKNVKLIDLKNTFATDDLTLKYIVTSNYVDKLREISKHIFHTKNNNIFIILFFK